ncbi:hypothetical protein [Pendulispora albinea]|uniref:Rhamnogalacturonan lyase domain-containing protein n=1 Tax=Pendulispora albinea TaxID=2741071 RepID=A0ABZ2LTC1_9BACT
MSRSGFLSRKILVVALAPLVVVATGIISQTALAGSVRGKISGQEKLLPDVYLEASKSDSHRFTWREPSPVVRAEFRNLTANPSRDLCIAAFSAGNQPAHPPILVKVTGGHTNPTTLVVAPGTRISFENRDPFPHRLYVVGSDAWKAEDTGAGARREWTAASQGRVEFRDQLFPSVRMFILVDPQVVDVAFPARDGSYAVNLPAGDYVLKAFFNGRQVGRALSVVAKDKGNLDLKEPLNVGEGAN